MDEQVPHRHQPASEPESGITIRRMSAALTIVAAVALSACATSQPVASDARRSIPTLDVVAYMGTWHEIAHYPNRFQRQCLGDTTAQYRLVGADRIVVTNRCRTTSGFELVTGEARTRNAQISDGKLMPASLAVSFLPGWLRWLPIGWGSYDVVHLAADGTYAIVSEPTQEYLWVLSRTARADPAQWAEIERWLRENNFDLTRLVRTSQS